MEELREIIRALMPSSNALSLAQALDQRAAQEKSACEFGIFRRSTQLFVILLAHSRIFLGQQSFVADSLRLGVLQRHVPALALVAVQDVLIFFLAQNFYQFVFEIERVMNPAVHPHGANGAVHMSGVAGKDCASEAEFFRNSL